MTPTLSERRVLGALRFVDSATGVPAVEGLVVRSPVASLRPNRSGLWVIWSAAGLRKHTDAFLAPPSTPDHGTIVVPFQVEDRRGRYLPRSGDVHLPRDPDPEHAANPDSLFQPVQVPLYLSASAPVAPGWALVRAHVADARSGAALDGAMLLVRTSAGAVLARGMSDARGEALVAVPGIPVTTFSTDDAGPPLVTGMDVTVEARFDATAGAAPDPEALEKAVGLPSKTVPANLAAGRQLFLSFDIALQ